MQLFLTSVCMFGTSVARAVTCVAAVSFLAPCDAIDPIEKVIVSCYDRMLEILDSLHLIASLDFAHSRGWEAVDQMVAKNWRISQ
jgi:hypothetical protein